MRKERSINAADIWLGAAVVFATIAIGIEVAAMSLPPHVPELALLAYIPAFFAWKCLETSMDLRSGWGHVTPQRVSLPEYELDEIREKRYRGVPIGG